MIAARHRITYLMVLALAVATLALASQATVPAGAASFTQCQHPLVTGVEVESLHHITSRAACPVALALFHWWGTNENFKRLYGCHGFHGYLRLHTFEGWHLNISSDNFFSMSRGDASFVVIGQDFPIDCF